MSDGLTDSERRLAAAVERIAPHYRPRDWRFTAPGWLIGPALPLLATCGEFFGIYTTPTMLVAVAAAGCADGERGAWLAFLTAGLIERYVWHPAGTSAWYAVYLALVALCFTAKAQSGLLRWRPAARARRSVSSINRNARSSLSIG